MLEIEDVGRDQPVGGRQPALADRPRDSPRRSDRNRASARRAAAPQARAVEQDRAGRRAMLGRDRLGHRRHPRIDRQRQFFGDEIAQVRTWLQAARRTNDSGCAGLQEDRPADLGAEGLAVEDHVRALALDADLVGFLEMDAAQLACRPSLPPRLATKARSSDTGRSSIASSLSAPARLRRRARPTAATSRAWSPRAARSGPADRAFARDRDLQRAAARAAGSCALSRRNMPHEQRDAVNTWLTPFGRPSG